MALKAGNDSINVVWQSGSVSLIAIVVIVFDQWKPRKSFFAPECLHFMDVAMFQKSFSQIQVYYCLNFASEFAHKTFCIVSRSQ